MRRLIDVLIFRRKPRKPKRFKATWATFLPAPWRRRLVVGAAGLVFAVAGAVGARAAWQSAYALETLAALEEVFDGLLMDAGFVVRSVAVEGLSEARREEVVAALGVEIGQPIFSVDPEAARARLERMGWVKSAGVGRRLDGSVDARVEERKPFALWQRDGRLYLIDREGAAITDRNLGRFARLPLVVGPDAARHAADLLDMLATEPSLYPRVAAAMRAGGRRWTVRLDNGIEVHLPEDGASAAWARLARLEREHDLLSRAVVAIDLRLPDRTVLKLTPAGSWRLRDGGQQT